MTRPTSRGLFVSIAVVLGASITAPARANDPATATMLFNEARRLISSHHYAEACPKFEESQRLDPGIGTQFNLADCYEHTQRTASAWALFLDVASTAGGMGQEARENVARKRAAALEPKLSKLTVIAPKNVMGLEVRRNGEPLAGVLWNNPIPVDPGSYTIEASAPGKKKWSTVATVGPDGAAVAVTVPPLEAGDAPVPSPTASAASDDGQGSPSQSAPDSRPDDLGRVERIAALGLGGAGIVGLALGSFFGLKSISKHSDYEALCGASGCSPAAGPIHDSAVAAGNVSTVTFLLGGALVAGGAVLWFMAPKAAPPSALRVVPVVGASNAGLVLAGGW